MLDLVGKPRRQLLSCRGSYLNVSLATAFMSLLFPPAKAPEESEVFEKIGKFSDETSQNNCVVFSPR